MFQTTICVKSSENRTARKHFTPKMNIYQKDFNQNPEIFTLIKARKNEEAKAYLRKNPADINLKGWMDDTPLHQAAGCGNLEMVAFLIKNGAEVNAERSGVYATPLCWADNRAIAQLLLDNGATMLHEELYFATRTNKPEVVDLLLANGAKINASEPQYLICNSIECIKIYLKYNILINGCDAHGSNLLHQLAWLDAPEVFDFAYANGCTWQKDDASRTPYHSAKGGGRNKIVKHLEQKYSKLIAPKIIPIARENYAFERLVFFKQSPTQANCFFGLTMHSHIIKFVLTKGELLIAKMAKLDAGSIKNFAFDKNGNIILPTADAILLHLNASSLHLIATIRLAEDADLDQITYLPQKNIFLGSHKNWQMMLLNDEFKVITTVEAENGTIIPHINATETLVSFFSYDQETYYCLYRLDDDLSMTYIDTFFKDFHNSSVSFVFNQQQMAVAFPKTVEYYTYQNNKLNTEWAIDIAQYPSLHDASYLALLNDETLLLAKGKTILYLNPANGTIYKNTDLDLSAEITAIYIDSGQFYCFVFTANEYQVIPQT